MRVKAKGCFWYPKTTEDYESNWNKDFSMMVVQKCTEIMLIEDINPEAIIGIFTDKFDFMKYYKAKGASVLMHGDQPTQKTCRYYVSTAGLPLKKIDPPRGPEGGFKRKNSLTDKFYESVLSSIPAGTWDERIHTGNRSKYQEVITSIEAGRKVKLCNNANDFNWGDVDWNYYIKEIFKLRIG